MCDIDKDILKPAIKELTKECNLFNQIRIPFKNLSYEKKKDNGRRHGGNVIGIEFTFKPENITFENLRGYKWKCKARIIKHDDQGCVFEFSHYDFEKGVQ